MDVDLTGNVALVTGAARGIGGKYSRGHVAYIDNADTALFRAGQYRGDMSPAEGK